MTTHPVSRRTVLTGLFGLGAAAAGLSGCSSKAALADPGSVASAEAARPTTGKVRDYRLHARPTEIDLGGQIVSTWTYGGALPGTALRATAGDRVRIAFTNDLPEATSVHWHGLAIRNDMDGVPDLTMKPVPPGGHFAFDFVIPHAGTHWLHPHTGLQLDRGLYAPFIVDDPTETGDYDTEWVVVLDDWTDGIGPSPEQILANLKADGTSRGGMESGGMGGMGSSDSGDVAYPLYLINGRPPNDPNVLRSLPGLRVRLRIINAAADTVFDVALGGHQLQISRTDGYPVTPVITSALRIGMGERYDAVVTLKDGVFPLVAEAVGKNALARALVRTGSGRAPAASLRPAELDATPLTVSQLQTRPGGALPRRTPDSVQNLVLGGSMTGYTWTINGRTHEHTRPLTVHQGQLTRLRIRNATMMTHPVHVHGHTFQLGSAGGIGPRKDTVLLPAMGAIDVDLLADNPGRWMVHCHNAYHAEAGMMTRLDYLT
jgi:FtsP/CotA-like multicopper oxidase with cupredoxin domain